MKQQKNYLDHTLENPVIAIVKGIDRDVERGEDVLMFGLSVVMLSPTLAPILPPKVLLPLVALTFAISSTLAHRNYQAMAQKLKCAMLQLEAYEAALLHPIVQVFKDYPTIPPALAFNPLKNWQRTFKSLLGGLLINPLWMPIFYVLGIQIYEEKNLAVLNKAVIHVERKIMPVKTTQ